MTDPIHEQISSFLDGELPGAESELLLKRLQRDAQLRNTVGRYALIGEALRSTEAGGPTRDFAARVSRAIEQEGAPGKSWHPVTSWLKPVAGGAIAAGVAAVALVSLRITPTDRAGGQEVAIQVEAPQVESLVTQIPVEAAPRLRESPPSETVPVDVSNFPAPPIRVINNGRLANFVMAHSEYSTPLGRRNVLTGLLAEEAIDQNIAVDEPASMTVQSGAARQPASKSNDQSTNQSSRGLATR